MRISKKGFEKLISNPFFDTTLPDLTRLETGKIHIKNNHSIRNDSLCAFVP